MAWSGQQNSDNKKCKHYYIGQSIIYKQKQYFWSSISVEIIVLRWEFIFIMGKCYSSLYTDVLSVECLGITGEDNTFKE